MSPVYEYLCPNEHVHEALVPLADRKHVRTCPICHMDATKIMSACALKFIGTGWFCNDYPKEADKCHE